jgi:hypothetical protein
MLRGLLFCTCGTRIKSDGTMGTPPRRRKAHLAALRTEGEMIPAQPRTGIDPEEAAA